MKYVWQRKVFGRVEGQVEEIDPAIEPRLTTWITAELVIEQPPSTPRTKKDAAAKLAILNEK